MIVADGTNFHVGWIESRHGIFNFSVAFGATGAADLRSLKVDSHLSRLIHDSNNGVQIQDRLSKARTGQEFASIFQDVVNEINHESTLPDISFSSELIISHLEFIGWKRVVRVNSDFSKIKLVTWDCCGRSHTFDLELGGNYPTVPPTIHISLPEPVVLKWTNRSNLATVLSDVDDSITKYQELFQVLCDIDEHLNVLEPLQPTFATSTRRIAIERACSVIVDIDPKNPSSLCEMRFLGPPAKVQDLRRHLSRNMDKWSNTDRFVENIERMLGITLPGKSCAAEEQDHSECAICYSYSLASSDIEDTVESAGDELSNVIRARFSIPDQLCPNSKCARLFHSCCLIDWLQALPSTRSSFGSLFGGCPYCHEPLSVVQIVR